MENVIISRPEELENLEAYKKVYNVVILNDGTMNHVNKLLREMIK